MYPTARHDDLRIDELAARRSSEGVADAAKESIRALRDQMHAAMSVNANVRHLGRTGLAKTAPDAHVPAFLKLTGNAHRGQSRQHDQADA